jgi:hypothetical protein
VGYNDEVSNIIHITDYYAYRFGKWVGETTGFRRGGNIETAGFQEATCWIVSRGNPYEQQ